jgi:hypothetical protein
MIPRMLALTVLVGWLSPSFAADLAKVDRTLHKQPQYTGKPGYCLLLFGPGGGHRVWLVHDGDRLYVDKNGNGDLTEPGERIAAEKGAEGLAFYVGTIRAGRLEHRNVTVRLSRLADWGPDVTSLPVSRAALRKNKDVALVTVSAEVEVPGLHGSGDGGRLAIGARFDSDGPLLFADSPAEAPVVHLGGPLHLRTEAARPTLYRNVVHDLMLTVGTPGVGPGTFAQVGYDTLIPKQAIVVVEGEFASKQAGAPPIRERFELKERC